MAANSIARRWLKQLLVPVINDRTYSYVQGASKAWDIRSGGWSEPELALIPHAVRAGETAIDLGANYGLYCYHLSRAVGCAGRVYAFEPIPFTFDALRHVARLLGFSHNVELVQKGVSDEGARVAFAVPLQSSGAFSAGQSYIGGRDDDRAGRESQVRWQGTTDVICEVIALDEFLPQLDNLSLIKCDIEGAELLAFRGAERMIARHLPTVICEINPWFLGGFNLRLEDLTGFFFEKGYGLYFYEGGQGRQRLRPVGAEEVVEDNYVFIHPSRRERFTTLLD